VPDLSGHPQLLSGLRALGELGLEDLVASYRFFCQWEPLGGMFLGSVLEELLDQARGCSWHYN
jgi:hypothetical protein